MYTLMPKLSLGNSEKIRSNEKKKLHRGNREEFWIFQYKMLGEEELRILILFGRLLETRVKELSSVSSVLGNHVPVSPPSMLQSEESVVNSRLWSCSESQAPFVPPQS